MLYKPPKDKPVEIKRNRQVQEVQKAVKRKTYTVKEVAEIVRLSQEQGGNEDGR